jgi:hypothetical protein
VSLRAVAEDRHPFFLDDREVCVVIVIHFHVMFP